MQATKRISTWLIWLTDIDIGLQTAITTTDGNPSSCLTFYNWEWSIAGHWKILVELKGGKISDKLLQGIWPNFNSEVHIYAVYNW